MKDMMLNNEIDFITRANSILNPIDPKSGILLLGNKGLEFRAEKSQGYIQIPWSSIVRVRVQIFFRGRYVRGFFIETDENQELEFIISDAKNVLKKMRKYLNRDQFVPNKSNFAGILKHRKTD